MRHSRSGVESGRAWMRGPHLQQLVLAATIGILAAGMALAYPDFATAPNAEVLAMGFVLEGLMAVGMTPLIVAGGIDLSVGAVLPFSAIAVALLLRAGFPIPLAIAVTVLVAGGVGLINAVLSLTLGVHGFIVTLATMLVLRGLALVVTHGAPITGLPPAFAFLGQGALGGVPVPLLLFAALALVFGFCLRNHRTWRQVYFVGGNARAAASQGVRIGRVVAAAYVLSSLMAGFAGVVAASQYGSASVGYGQNAELRVITAVVIGGARLSGGTGSIGGTVLGVLFLAVLYNAFVTTGVSTYWQDVASGALVLTAVLCAEVFAPRRRTVTA